MYRAYGSPVISLHRVPEQGVADVRVREDEIRREGHVLLAECRGDGRQRRIAPHPLGQVRGKPRVMGQDVPDGRQRRCPKRLRMASSGR